MIVLFFGYKRFDWMKNSLLGMLPIIFVYLGASKWKKSNTIESVVATVLKPGIQFRGCVANEWLWCCPLSQEWWDEPCIFFVSLGRNCNRFSLWFVYLEYMRNHLKPILDCHVAQQPFQCMRCSVIYSYFAHKSLD